MARKIWLSILALLVAFCLGLSLVAAAGAVVVVFFQGAAPTGMIPFLQGGVFF